MLRCSSYDHKKSKLQVFQAETLKTMERKKQIINNGEEYIIDPGKGHQPKMREDRFRISGVCGANSLDKHAEPLGFPLISKYITCKINTI